MPFAADVGSSASIPCAFPWSTHTASSGESKETGAFLASRLGPGFPSLRTISQQRPNLALWHIRILSCGGRPYLSRRLPRATVPARAGTSPPTTCCAVWAAVLQYAICACVAGNVVSAPRTPMSAASRLTHRCGGCPRKHTTPLPQMAIGRKGNRKRVRFASVMACFASAHSSMD